MLAVAVDLLTGRYGATEYNDRGRAEWPPHPARLFTALVAAWADSDHPAPEERAALIWLEAQGAPQLGCSDHEDVSRRGVVTVYVPGNDPTALRSSVDARYAGWETTAAAVRKAQDAGDARTLRRAQNAADKAAAACREAVRKATMPAGTESASVIRTVLEMLPDNRNRQPRTFPTVTPGNPKVWLVWPDAEPTPEMRATLDGLLARVGRIGHSSTLVSCRVTDPPHEPPALVPRADGPVVLRVAREGLLDRLEREFVRHQGTRERVLPAAMAAYGAPDPPRTAPPSGVLSGDWIVLELPSRTIAGQRQAVPRITRSLELARAVRDALLLHAPAASHGIISGLFEDGQPRLHLAVVPLGDIGHRWADGTVRGVALVLPRDESRVPVEQALQAWQNHDLTARLGSGDRQRQLALGPPRLAPAEEGWSDVPFALRRPTWCRPSRRWVTATPVALDRHVRGLHDPSSHTSADGRARDVVAAACAHAGLPEPVDVVISPVGMTAAVPAAPRGMAKHSPGRRPFPRFVAAGSGQARQCVHVALTFPEVVRGPVLIGAGRYLGYGLFLPIRDEGEDRQ